jgi:hypothetical protein
MSFGTLSVRTAEKDRTFLTALSEGASITSACDAAGYGRRTAYDWREKDLEFRAAWDDAVEAGTDRLEDAAYQRGKETSDTLLIFTLKGRRPQKWSEKHQMTIDARVAVADLSDLEVAQRFAYLLEQGAAALPAPEPGAEE